MDFNDGDVEDLMNQPETEATKPEDDEMALLLQGGEAAEKLLADITSGTGNLAQVKTIKHNIAKEVAKVPRGNSSIP
jgi:hypothetical protein